ncbi:MAG: hypothetical protein U1E53_17360 [Dongiaceae bacterium]
MRSSLPWIIGASLSLALCLAAAAAVADTAAQAPSDTAAQPSLGWSNTDPRYPTPPSSRPQGAIVDTAAGTKPVVVVPQASDTTPRRNTDPRYPSN